jgi:hypothetical protein
VRSATIVRLVGVLISAWTLTAGHGTVALSGQSGAYGLTIPAAHPRLWWNAERRALAASWYQSHPFNPSSSDPLAQAFRCVVTGEANYCQAAVNYAMNQMCNNAACNSPDPNVGVAADDARWEGENVILVFDWCYQYFTPTQRTTLINRWNTYFHNIRQHTWGGPSQHQSNYNWGYMRNEIEWGIATWGENAQADANLQHGLITRWQNNSIPHFLGGGRGGVLQEGSAYGSAIGQYSVVPFGSAALLGRDVTRETNFFREAVMYMVYSTLPAPTYNKNNGGSFIEMFPFADDERFFDGGMPTRINYGSFMQAMADYWRAVPIGAFARQWINTVNPTRPPHIAAVDRGGSAASFATLPLDYFASGPRWLFTRNQWGPLATSILLQLGVTEDEGHQHNDVGSWQMWRNGRWLSRESTGYSQNIVGFAGTQVDTNNAAAHNSLFVGTLGPASGWRVGQSTVRRLESRPVYSYINVDLTPTYRATHPSLDNTAASHVEREFIFLKPIETLVVFDRIESTSAAPAKTFLAHFEASPTVDQANRVVTAVNGSQALRVMTLVPSSPTYRPIVNEGGQVGQFRLEVQTGGAAQSYFLNVLQAKGVSDANVAATVVDAGSSYVLTVAHPTLGNAVITLQKGRESTGGTITIGGATTGFSTTVQAMSVSDSGVSWGGAGGTTLPNAPTGLRIVPGL